MIYTVTVTSPSVKGRSSEIEILVSAKSCTEALWRAWEKRRREEYDAAELVKAWKKLRELRAAEQRKGVASE